MNEGYFAIHRKLLNSDLWLSERFTKGQAWVDLIGLANHKDKEILVGFKSILIKRGQVLTSQLKLAKRWRWDRKTVVRFLKFMETSEMIHNEVDRNIQHGFTVITIKNYDTYQRTGQQEGQQEGQQGRTKRDSKRDTNNNDNNDNNDNNNTKVKISNTKIQRDDIKKYKDHSDYIADSILDLVVKKYNAAAKTPFNESSYLRDVTLIELLPLAIEVGVNHGDLKEFATELYGRYADGKTKKGTIKNFKQFLFVIIRNSQQKLRDRFGEMSKWTP